MEKRKWWLSFVLAVFILSVGMASSAFGQETAGIKFSAVEVSPGQEGFIVDCIITDHPVITGVGFSIQYPDVLEYVESEVKNFGWALPAGFDHNPDTRTLSILGIGSTTLTAATETVLASLTFNISSSVNEEAYGLTVVSTGQELANDNGYLTVTADTTSTITIAKVPTVTATASPDGFGTISPSGEKTYDAGESPTYTVTPAQDYRVKTFTVSSDAEAKLSNGTAGGTYTFGTALKEGDNIAINVVFELIPTYKVTASAGENGTISDEGEKTYNEDSTPTYKVTPDKHYEVDTFEVLGDDEAALKDNGDGTFSYPYAALKANSTISVTFKLKQYTVTATAGANGAISKPGETLYGALSIPAYTITPDAANNYIVDTCTVNGADVKAQLVPNADGTLTYPFAPLEANATIDVTFKLGVFQVTMVAKTGGSIVAVVGESYVTEVVTVIAGGSQQFKIKMNEGYEFFNVKVTDEDGTVADKVTKLDDGNKFTLTVDKNYTVTAKFQLKHMVSVTVTPSTQIGAVAPSGDVWVEDGGTLDITVTLNDGWDATLYAQGEGEATEELVEEYTESGVQVYSLADITSDYTVLVEFEKDGTFHTADCNMDFEIDGKDEMLDFISLFKASGVKGYFYDGKTASVSTGCVIGFAVPEEEVSEDACKLLPHHSSDADGDCYFSLSEFLDTVVLWKYGYKKDPVTGGFVPDI